MAKKQVAVSLRKPPSPDSIDAFVSGDEPPVDAALPKRARRASTKSVSAEAEVSPVPPSVTPVPTSGVVSVEAREREEAPRAPAAPAASSVAPSPLPEPTVVSVVGGVPLRPVTIYLTQELAERLTFHCIQHDRDVSNVIGDALTNHLAPRLGAGTASSTREPSSAPPPRPSSFWGSPPFPQVEWPPRRLDQIVEIGRILLNAVRRRGYAASA